MDKRFKNFEKFYCNQAGGGDDYPVFKGSRYMRGHGFLGRMLGKVARPLWALFGKHLLSAGLNVADDVISKKRKFKEAFGVHGRAAGRQALDDTSSLLNRSMASLNQENMDHMDHAQTGGGKKQRKRGPAKQKAAAKPRKKAKTKKPKKPKKPKKRNSNPKSSFKAKPPSRAVKFGQNRQNRQVSDFFQNL